MAPFLLKDEVLLKKNSEMVIKRIGMGQSWMTQKEKKDYEEAARYTIGMQQQRAFTLY